MSGGGGGGGRAMEGDAADRSRPIGSGLLRDRGVWGRGGGEEPDRPRGNDLGCIEWMCSPVGGCHELGAGSSVGRLEIVSGAGRRRQSSTGPRRDRIADLRA